MRRCQHDFYLDIKVMTCHSSLVLPSSSSATCSAWELSLGRNHGNLAASSCCAASSKKHHPDPQKRRKSEIGTRVLGHKWCMPTNYKVTITIVIIVINHHLPTLFLLLHLHRSRIQWLQILRFQSPECQSLFTDLEVTSQLFEAINKSNPFSLELL